MSCHLGYVLRRLVGLWGLFHFHILFLAEESLTSVCRAYFLSQPGIHSTMESLKRIPFFSTGEYLNPGAYFCSGWSMLRQYHPGCQRCIFMHVADHDVHLCRTAHVIHYRMRNLPSSLLSSLSSLLSSYPSLYFLLFFHSFLSSLRPNPALQLGCFPGCGTHASVLWGPWASDSHDHFHPQLTGFHT